VTPELNVPLFFWGVGPGKDMGHIALKLFPLSAQLARVQSRRTH